MGRMVRKSQFGNTQEAIIYPLLLLVVMWLVFWADHLFDLVDFYKYGVKPRSVEGLKGILFMPLIHAKHEIEHIVNNSVPTVILLGTVIYYYRPIALRVFVFSWLFTGLGTWLFATSTFSYHIGMSGIIYALAGFLFTSGVIRKYLPLQAIALFVSFVYGSMIWGIFPIQPHVSWEGHLMGLITGVVLAFIYRKLGPQAPKYQYEIEKEMGIEPPDLEGEWNERIRQEKLRREEMEKRLSEEHQISKVKITYHFKPKEPKDDTDEK